jgi:mRNA interferase MazF
VIRRGEIYWVNLDPTVGSEIKKTRPALIISNDSNNQFSDTVTVLPITSNTSTIRPFEVLLKKGIGGIKESGKIKANQIRTVDKKRLSSYPLGPVVSEDVLNLVIQAIRIHLEL